MSELHVINLSADRDVCCYDWRAIPEYRRAREERALNIVRQSKLHGFAVQFWEGEMDTFAMPCTNISRAFKKIVRYAKQTMMREVTIAEDDIEFTSGMSWVYYMMNRPVEDFDLYLGGLFAGELDGTRVIRGYSGNTLMTVHERFYDFFLSANEDEHLDRWLGGHAHEKKYFVCLPFVCKQITPAFSESQRRVIDSYEAYEQAWQYLV